MKNVLQTKACISRQHFAALFASALLAVAITATPIAAVAQTSDSAAAKQNLNSAGEQFNLGGLKGVHSNQKERMPPPGWNYSNCGGKCEDYDTDDGYYLGGTESEEAPGQTLAAHDLCSGLRPYMKRHHLQADVGHYGVFSGRRWDTQVYPIVQNFILSMDDGVTRPVPEAAPSRNAAVGVGP